jgi:iron complex transport system substrate-binding protein
MKKALSIFITLLLIVTMLAACSQNSGTNVSPSPSATAETATPSSSASTDPEQIKIENTDTFSIKALADGVKLVTDAENRKLLLIPRGQDVPSGYEDATVINTPVENVLFCSTTQVCMLRPFGDLWDTIGGVMQDKGAWPFEEVEAGLADGSMTYVGNGSAPDYELIRELNPDITFVYTGDYGQQDIIAKLEELGLPYAVDNEYMETTHEGRMEWVKFIGTFYNRDADADAYVEGQLQKLSEMEMTVKNSEKPKVIWGMIYDGTVYVPNGGSYVAKSIEAAGGDYLFKDVEPNSGSSSQLSVEEFYDKLTEADIWIYSSNMNYVPDYEALSGLAPITDKAPVVTDKNVWQFSVDYYFATDQSDQQVIELAAIFHPDLYPNYSFVHYNKLAG